MREFRFSREEIRDILIALVVLVFIFSLSNIISGPRDIITALVASFFAVGIGFIGHELAHKYMANRFGYFAEFRLWKEGILMAILFAAATGGKFFFAAPGAVVFAGTFFRRPTKKSVGKIGLAGPAFNLAAMAVFFLLYMATGMGLFRFSAVINTWLALFNMIPIHPLDGGKVFAWSKGAWAVTGIAGLASLALLL